MTKTIYSSQGTISQVSKVEAESEKCDVLSYILDILQLPLLKEKAEELMNARAMLIGEMGKFCMAASEKDIKLADYLRQAKEYKSTIAKIKFR